MQFLLMNAHKSALLSTINLFLLENIWFNEKNCNFRHFFVLRNNVNLRTFFTPENWLADKSQLFPCLQGIKKIECLAYILSTWYLKMGHFRLWRAPQEIELNLQSICRVIKINWMFNAVKKYLWNASLRANCLCLVHL